MARPKYDPNEKKVPKSCASIIEQLISHETVYLERTYFNQVIGRYAKETGLYSFKKDTDKPCISRKQDFKVNRRTTHYVFFKVL